ncbi:MAG: GGDEF domain-containing protein, partial [Rhodospirillales bacterium]|nr:GGDEF domain-containing protein [Rhodospirillales bacterium]MCW8951225.1 GGDEF domain-containing protein [Rhodospirillales bacterium]
EVVAFLYTLLPFVIIGGLAVFPLTLQEVTLAVLTTVTALVFCMAWANGITPAVYIGKVWLAVLFGGISAFASISQLRYMIILLARASVDPLTGCYTRRSGSEIIDIQFRVAMRQGMPFSVAMFDLDDFKKINDTAGHEAGDAVLTTFVASLNKMLRASDAIVRWGGEEFIVAFPNNSVEGLNVVIRRILGGSLGKRPDGSPLTVSIGIAEATADGMEDWVDLVKLADERMYDAKRAGKNRARLPSGTDITVER